MVIAVVSFALALDVPGRHVGTGIGSAAPTPIQAVEAVAYLEHELGRGGYWEDHRELSTGIVGRFADLVAGAARPIDDVRGSAGYRVHALRVMARRTLRWVWADLLRDGSDAG